MASKLEEDLAFESMVSQYLAGNLPPSKGLATPQSQLQAESTGKLKDLPPEQAPVTGLSVTRGVRKAQMDAGQKPTFPQQPPGDYGGGTVTTPATVSQKQADEVVGQELDPLKQEDLKSKIASRTLTDQQRKDNIALSEERLELAKIKLERERASDDFFTKYGGDVSKLPLKELILNVKLTRPKAGGVTIQTPQGTITTGGDPGDQEMYKIFHDEYVHRFQKTGSSTPSPNDKSPAAPGGTTTPTTTRENPPTVPQEQNLIKLGKGLMRPTKSAPAIVDRNQFNLDVQKLIDSGVSKDQAIAQVKQKYGMP
jgi:hypothetical protein